MRDERRRWTGVEGANGICKIRMGNTLVTLHEWVLESEGKRERFNGRQLGNGSED
jgi:hypothetical protein